MSDAAEKGQAQTAHINNALPTNPAAPQITLTQAQFESLYLQPRDPYIKGGLNKILANPTPLGMAAFATNLTVLSMDLSLGMAWRDAGLCYNSGTIIFFGGMVQTIVAIMEFIVGNTLPFVIIGTFGGFWLFYASLINPTLGVAASFALGDAAAGATTVAYNVGIGHYLMIFGIMCFIYTICTLRTNFVFFWIMLTITIEAWVLAGAYYALAQGKDASDLIVAGGAIGFACSMGGWYLLAAQLFSAVNMPFTLPVGDFSEHLLVKREKAA